MGHEWPTLPVLPPPSWVPPPDRCVRCGRTRGEAAGLDCTRPSVTPEQTAGVLYRKWTRTHGLALSNNTHEAHEAARRAWLDLVEYVDSHGLTHTAADPR